MPFVTGESWRARFNSDPGITVGQPGLADSASAGSQRLLVTALPRRFGFAMERLTTDPTRTHIFPT